MKVNAQLAGVLFPVLLRSWKAQRLGRGQQAADAKYSRYSRGVTAAELISIARFWNWRFRTEDLTMSNTRWRPVNQSDVEGLKARWTASRQLYTWEDILSYAGLQAIMNNTERSIK